MTAPDLWALYRHMLRSRQFEAAVRDLWQQGKISGEMHLNMGEEAVIAGIVCQLKAGDAMALDHRGTAPLVVRGIDLVLLLKELLGHEDGLCHGQGGHMHLYAPDLLAASSGIVGAAGPAAAGFALANIHLRPGRIALAFFGEGAMNQGMLLESFNLAAAWKLPVLFICRNNDWAITTHSSEVTGGDLLVRAAGFGLPTREVDGTDAEAVWHAAQEAITHARDGHGPSFLLAHCPHLEGHFLGDPLLRIVRRPVAEFSPYLSSITRHVTARRGAGFRARAASMRKVTALLRDMRRADRQKDRDPVSRLRQKLVADSTRLAKLEQAVSAEITQVVSQALAGDQVQEVT